MKSGLGTSTYYTLNAIEKWSYVLTAMNDFPFIVRWALVPVLDIVAGAYTIENYKGEKDILWEYGIKI